jgi:hypothetical protein
MAEFCIVKTVNVCLRQFTNLAPDMHSVVLHFFAFLGVFRSPFMTTLYGRD